MFKKVINIVILLIVLAALAIGGYLYYQHGKLYPSTDDAYVQANIVEISPQVSGKVSDVFVQNNQYVKKGQSLFNIDPKTFQVALQKAQANLANTIQKVKAQEAAVIAAKALVAQRQAELNNTIKTTRRIMTLVRRRLYPRAAGDTAIRNLKVAEAALLAAQSQLKEAQQILGQPGDANANIKAAKAAISQAKINLKYTKIQSPTSGYVAKFTLRKGTDVTAYQEAFAIVDNSQWWVSANFKETNLQRIRKGQPATIKVDIYSEHTFKGVVTSISPGSGASFALLPPENASGNWVKVTQRFPVRIDIVKPDPKYPLRIGASCTVTIDTKSVSSSQQQAVGMK